MSPVSKPTIQSYWTIDKSIETLDIKNIMRHNRFISMSKNVYLSSKNSSTHKNSADFLNSKKNFHLHVSQIKKFHLMHH